MLYRLLAIGDDNEEEQRERVRLFNDLIAHIQKHVNVRANGLKDVRLKNSLAQLLTKLEDFFGVKNEVNKEKKKLRYHRLNNKVIKVKSI